MPSAIDPCADCGNLPDTPNHVFGCRGRALVVGGIQEEIAEEIEAEMEVCQEHWPIPKGSCWRCQRHGAMTRCLRIVRDYSPSLNRPNTTTETGSR